VDLNGITFKLVVFEVLNSLVGPLRKGVDTCHGSEGAVVDGGHFILSTAVFGVVHRVNVIFNLAVARELDPVSRIFSLLNLLDRHLFAMLLGDLLLTTCLHSWLLHGLDHVRLYVAGLTVFEAEAV